jgi:Subtilase family
MKRLVINLILMATAVFLASADAVMQNTYRQQLGNRETLTQEQEPINALPQSYLNRNKTHKLIINNDDPEQTKVYNELVGRNAISNAINYGGFTLAVVDQDAVGGLEALKNMPVVWRDDLSQIAFNGYVVDTSDPQPLSRELPVDLRQQKMADAINSGIAPNSGLFTVQFVGPIKAEWRAAIEKTGARIITYIPNNAYIVRADSRAAFGVWQLKTQHPFVQYVGDYEPAFRMSPELRAVRQTDASAYVNVTVQYVDGPETAMKIEALKRTAVQFLGESRVLNYHNVTVTIPVSQLTVLANDDDVFAIEAYKKFVRMDEAQGQIVAGNLTGNSPSGPGYLAWLASKGFNSSQFGSFSVNVVDDATSLSGHPDLPSGRIAFQNNPSGQTGPQSGHGFLNANIIAGFNNGTGAAFEDASGFNYGLGIAPWARVGSTAVFGPVLADPSAWESTAYGQSARISSISIVLADETGAPLSRYESTAQLYDSIVRDARSTVAGLQQLTVVFAAGNFGSGSNTVASPSTAKNVISVGASENVRQTGTDGCGIPNSGANSANDMAGFSSRGPVNAAGGDGRVKPDIVAPGTHIQAGVPQSNYDGSGLCGGQFFPPGQTRYSWNSGTSHATPAVSGGAALVYQNFLNKGLGAPSPAMVKAFLMNSASYMTGTGAGGNLPSNSQGMGRMNLGRAFDGAPRILVNQTQLLNTTGQVYQVSGHVCSSTQPFRVTLAWTDAPGAITGAPWVNNLDLVVTVGGQTYRGNVFTGGNSRTGGAADVRNNVESVFLPPGVTGNFTITVRATNLAGDGVPGNNNTTDQDFALVIYNGRR